jgi:hypothetical protein
VVFLGAPAYRAFGKWVKNHLPLPICPLHSGEGEGVRGRSELAFFTTIVSLREIMNKPDEGTAIRLTQLAHGGG